MMANGRGFQEAAVIAKRLPRLATGCHVVLIDGVAVDSDLPTLCNGTGRFRSRLKEFAGAAWRRKIAADEVQREAEAQIRKIQSCGITLTHVDSHKHTHMFPHILRPLLRAAKKCGIPPERNPFYPRRSWPANVLPATP